MYPDKPDWVDKLLKTTNDTNSQFKECENLMKMSKV